MQLDLVKSITEFEDIQTTETEWRNPADSHEASCVLLHTSTEKCALVCDVKKTCIWSAAADVLIFQADNREK